MPLGAFRLNSLARRVAAAASRTAVTITANGNAQIDTAESKFGGASALFDGSNDNLSGTLNDSIGTGEFTYECWVYFTDTNGGGIISVGGIGLYLRSDEKLGFYNSNTSSPIIPTGSGTLTGSTWTHVAATRESDNYIRLYIDGSLDFTSSSTFTGDIGDGVVIGEFLGSVDYQGNIDEIRISNTARYTSGFTPSTSAFTNDANTVLLLHCDGTDGSTTFTDDNA